MPEPQAAVEHELAFFELDAARTEYPHRLSSGQRRRLLRPCALLVLDEPEQRLDPVMRVALAARLRSLATAGTALLVVTHDPVFLATVADFVLLVADGRVIPASVAQGAAAIARG